MKKRFTRWLVAMLTIIMVLSSSIGVLAAGDGAKPTVKETKKVTVTSSYAMFKLSKTEGSEQSTEGTVDVYTDGSMKLRFVYEGKSFLKMHLGKAADAETAAADQIYEAKQVENGYEYVIPVESLDTVMDAAVLSSKGSWKDNTLTIQIAESSKPDAGTTPGTDESGTNSGTDTTPGTEATVKETKNVTVTSSYAMFKLSKTEGSEQSTVGTVDVYTDGSMKLRFVYEGKSFLKMYLGKAADAGAAAADQIYEAKQVENGYEYVIPVESLDAVMDAAVLSSKGSWKDNTLTIQEVESSTPGTEATVKETKNVTVTSSYAMFKLSKTEGSEQSTAGTVDVYTDGSMKLKFVYEGKSFLKMYLGKAADAETAAADQIYEAKQVENGYEYVIPVESLDAVMDAAVLSSKGSWKDNTLTIQEVASSTPDTDVPGTDTPGDDTPGTETPSGTTVILPNGTYSVAVETGASMFRVVDCKIVVKNKTIQAVITLSGTGYDYLYQGTKDAAEKADPKTWSKYRVGADGRYQYVVSIPYADFVADKTIPVASRSAKNTTWFARTMDFDLNSLAVVSASTEVDGSIPSGGNAGSNAGKPSGGNSGSSTSKPEEDKTLTDAEINNKLESVDKDKTVKDGTYKPEFGFTGGSGRATISCNKVVVKNGKATATITFSSPNFTWVKSQGKTVYNENKGGNSVFTIPVNLNGKTNISAETTAMSQPYTVEYTLYCFIDGTKVTTSGGSNKAESTDDVIALEGASVEESDGTSTDMMEESGWGSFYDEVEEEAAVSADAVAQSNDTLVKVLTVALILVCIYAAAGTVFAVTKMRKMKGE